MQYTKININELIELPWKKTFYFLRQSRHNKIIERISDSINPINEFLVENFHKINNLTLVDPFRLLSLLEILINIKEIKGDIVECGSYKGGTGILIALALDHFGINKNVYLFDSFQGLPSPSINDSGYSKGAFISNKKELQENIEKFQLNNIQIIDGWFKDTISDFIQKYNKKISFLHIDCDLYESTADCFPKLFPLVNNGGVIICDDFNDGSGGEKKAVLDAVGQKNYIFNIGPAPQMYFYKSQTTNYNLESTYFYQEETLTYSFEDLFMNSDYIKYLDDKLGYSYKNLVINNLSN
jgi:O-methyltransferase